jgi:hypothetical protein
VISETTQTATQVRLLSPSKTAKHANSAEPGVEGDNIFDVLISPPCPRIWFSHEGIPD